LCHRIAEAHAPDMTPDEVVDYVVKLNNLIYQRIVTNAV
jgi:hypothetical protein